MDLENDRLETDLEHLKSVGQPCVVLLDLAQYIRAQKDLPDSFHLRTLFQHVLDPVQVT